MKERNILCFTSIVASWAQRIKLFVVVVVVVVVVVGVGGGGGGTQVLFCVTCSQIVA